MLQSEPFPFHMITCAKIEHVHGGSKVNGGGFMQRISLGMEMLSQGGMEREVY